jgi:hypothetical protein
MIRGRLSYYVNTSSGYEDNHRDLGCFRDPDKHKKIVERKKKAEELEQEKLRIRYSNFTPIDKNQKAKKVLPPTP